MKQPQFKKDTGISAPATALSSLYFPPQSRKGAPFFVDSLSIFEVLFGGGLLSVRHFWPEEETEGFLSSHSKIVGIRCLGRFCTRLRKCFVGFVPSSRTFGGFWSNFLCFIRCWVPFSSLYSTGSLPCNWQGRPLFSTIGYRFLGSSILVSMLYLGLPIIYISHIPNQSLKRS